LGEQPDLQEDRRILGVQVSVAAKGSQPLALFVLGRLRYPLRGFPVFPPGAEASCGPGTPQQHFGDPACRNPGGKVTAGHLRRTLEGF
jgi:hypothetical protein